MRVLVIMTALADAEIALVADGSVHARRLAAGPRGIADALPAMVDAVVSGVAPDLIAAVTGPGSFTGIRAGLALAHGLALGWGVRLVGVSNGEALAAALTAVEPEAGAETRFLMATDARTGRLHLEAGIVAPHDAAGPCRQAWSALLDDVEAPIPGTLLAGDAALALQAALSARGEARALAPVLLPDAVSVAAAALRASAGPGGHAREHGAALPLYIDPPRVSTPAEPAIRLRPAGAPPPAAAPSAR